MTEEAKPTETIEALVSAYATVYAARALLEWKLKAHRIRENISVASALCEREVRVDLRLPDIVDLGLPLPTGPGEGVEWIIPVWPMRRGQLLTDFEVDIQGHSARILDRQHSTRLTRELLGIDWQQVRQDAGAVPDPLEVRMQEWMQAICEDEPIFARHATVNSAKAIRGLLNAETDSLRNYFASAKFLSRRYIQWIATDAQPGESVVMRYSYRTRYAPEYVGQGERSWYDVRRHVGTLRRWSGQAPSYIMMPVSRMFLSRSYHVTFAAPEGCYLRVFEFVDQSMNGTSARTFNARVAKSGIDVTGTDECGGQVGHLYTYDYRSPRGVGVGVRARVAEVPPGTVTKVAWLTLVVALFLGIFCLSPGPLLSQDRLLVLAALAVFPAILSAWAGASLQTDVLAKASLAARWSTIGVWIVAVSILAISLLLGGHGTGSADLPTYVAALLWALCALMLACSLWLWIERFRTYRNYRSLQRRIAKRYGY